MKLELSLPIGNDFFAAAPTKSESSKDRVVFWIVMLLMLCWLPMLANLTLEKKQGNSFGAAAGSNGAAASAPLAR
ncbi:MAG: hypothetical protein V4709_06065 [Pseudomonadota bacterium]